MSIPGSRRTSPHGSLTDRLSYRLSSASDFGFLYCSAENEMGSMASSLERDKGESAAETNLFQDERCVFQIRRKGISQIERCDVRRVAPDTLDIECQAHPKELETKLRQVRS